MKGREWIPGILIAVALLGFSRLSPVFLDAHYLLSTTTLYAETGLLALGMTVVIVSGNIDLSVGSNMVLTGCLVAKLLAAGIPIPVAVVLACGIGTVLGAFNGILVAYLKLPSFLVTLGTMAAYRGAAQAMLGASSVKLPNGFKGIDQVDALGLPWPLWIFLLAALVVGFLLHGTVFGRWVIATGANEEASRYSGLPVERVKVLVFAMTGFLAGMGALLLDSRLAVARHDLARGVELEAITVVVVGGASILGGRGSILGTVLALFLIDLLKTGMGVANVKAEYQLTAIGVVLIVAALAMNFAEILQGRFGFRREPAKPVLE